MKIALIVGVNGQDGSYLARLLLKKGYRVVGLRRRTSSFNTERLNDIIASDYYGTAFQLVYSDLSDSSSLFRIINELRPNEIYNLAAMSHVHISFEIPEYVGDVDALGTLRILEAVRCSGLTGSTKIYQASTSELFGKVHEIPQNEKTPFYPRSPYACAKLYAYWITKNYREAYGMFAVNGILFNHESPLRGETFVTRKITLGISSILKGQRKCLYLGNLSAQRDWGHAKDFVEGMWLMMQQECPDDYVLATGEMHTVREFVELAFNFAGVAIEFRGEGENESGYIIKMHKEFEHLKIGDKVIGVDSKYFRPTEVELLLGDSSKARSILNWKPKSSFTDLVQEMMNNDLNN